MKTTYTVAGSMLLQEKRGNTTYDYYYDENGSIVGMKVGYNTYYYFGKNAQGDICAVYDGTGAQVASLTYDAYGNTVSVTNPNNLYIPFRYRGYYFDEETGFYYLQSRYYDPEIGRFISRDSYEYIGANGDVGSYNLFAYCSNNPGKYVDSCGQAAIALLTTLCATPIGGLFLGAITVVLGGTVINGIVKEATKLDFETPKDRITKSALIKLGSTHLSNSSSTSDEKSDTKGNSKSKSQSKQRSRQTNYWYAEIINGFVTPILPLSYSSARFWAASGRNILCINHSAAFAIIKFYPSAIHEGAHGSKESGYLNHYHLSSAHVNHIWYYGV